MKEETFSLSDIDTTEYSGRLVLYKDLEIGTNFYVVNGNWYGQILEGDKGQKRILVEATGSVRDVRPSDFAWVEIVGLNGRKAVMDKVNNW